MYPECPLIVAQAEAADLEVKLSAKTRAAADLRGVLATWRALSVTEQAKKHRFGALVAAAEATRLAEIRAVQVTKIENKTTYTSDCIWNQGWFAF
jgi:hypothetical protein